MSGVPLPDEGPVIEAPSASNAHNILPPASKEEEKRNGGNEKDLVGNDGDEDARESVRSSDSSTPATTKTNGRNWRNRRKKRAKKEVEVKVRRNLVEERIKMRKILIEEKRELDMSSRHITLPHERKKRIDKVVQRDAAADVVRQKSRKRVEVWNDWDNHTRDTRNSRIQKVLDSQQDA